MNKARNDNRWAVAVVFALVALFIGAAADIEFEKNRKRLRSMPTHERLRIEQNYQRFMQLSRDEKNQLRQLHKELSALSDEERAGLHEQMTQYLRWLDTLSPKDRQQLDQTTDPGQKIQLVQKLVEAQRAQLQEDLAPLRRYERPGNPDHESWTSRFWRHIEPDLIALEKQLQPKLADSEKKWFAAQDDSDHSKMRKLHVALFLSEKYEIEIPNSLRGPHSFATRMFAQLPFLNRWFGLRDGETIQDLPDDQRAEAIDLLVQFLLLPPISREELYKEYDTLDESDRIQVRDNPFTERYLLRAAYFRNHPDRIPKDQTQLREALTRDWKGPPGPPRFRTRNEFDRDRRRPAEVQTPARKDPRTRRKAEEAKPKEE